MFGGFGNQQPAQQQTTGLFGFSTPTTATQAQPAMATTTFGAPSIAATQPSSAFGGFGAPAPTSLPSAPSLFSGFGAATQPASTGTSFGFGGTMAPTTASPAFGGFGTTATSQPSAFGAFGSQTAAPAQSATFTFGAAPTQPATSANQPLSFGTSTPSFSGFGLTPAPSITAMTPVTTATSTGFGAFGLGTTQPAPGPATGSAFSFGQPAATTASAFSFNTPTTAVATQPASSAPSLFGGMQTSGFGIAPQSGVAQPQPAPPGVASAFGGFGLSTPSSIAPALVSASASASLPSTFSFATPNSVSAFQTTSTGFALGGIQPAPAAAAVSVPSAVPFTFTSPQTVATPASSSASGSVFSRLGGTSTSALPTSTGLSFAVPPQTSAPTATQSTVAPAPFSFGVTQQPSTAVTTASAIPAFSFGTPTVAAPVASTFSTIPTLSFSGGSQSQPAALNLSLPAPVATSAPAFSLGGSLTSSVSQPSGLPSAGFLMSSIAPTGTTSSAVSSFLPSLSSVSSSGVTPTTIAPSFGLNFPSVVSSQPTLTPLSNAVTAVVSSTTSTIPSLVDTNSSIPTTLPTTANSSLSSTTSTAVSTSGPSLSGPSGDMSNDDKKLLERFKKMTYEDFEGYLEETKRAVDQLEENWIQGTLKLNGFLSMRKENTKAMRLLREKMSTIWEFESKVERTLAAVNLSIAEIDETLSYLEKHVTDPDEFFKKNARRISAEDRYRANCYKTLDLLYREVRIALNDVDISRKKLMKNLIKEDEVRDLLSSKQMLSGQFEPKLLMENPHVLGTVAAMLMKDIKEVKNSQRQALTKLRFQKAQADALSR